MLISFPLSSHSHPSGVGNLGVSLQRPSKQVERSRRGLPSARSSPATGDANRGEKGMELRRSRRISCAFASRGCSGVDDGTTPNGTAGFWRKGRERERGRRNLDEGPWARISSTAVSPHSDNYL